MGGPDNKKPSIGLYLLSILSFIPILGALFGVGFIVYGLTSKKEGGKMLASIGTVGIIFTIIICFMFSNFIMPHGDAFDKGLKLLTEQRLSQVVTDIEYYKTQNGKYPESLEVLQQSLSLPKKIFQDTSTFNSKNAYTQEMGYFYYKVVDSDHYYLLGVGRDGVPFTSDDILPKVDPKMKTGLLKAPLAGEDKVHRSADEK